MRGLKVIDADLRARDVSSDGKHRHPAPLRVVQPVDEVEVARPRLPSQTARLPVRCASAAAANAAALFMADMNPVDASAA